MFAKLNEKLSQTRLSVRLVLAMMLLAATAFAVMAWELSGMPFAGLSMGGMPPVKDMAFLGALFTACGFVGWLYAADLDILGAVTSNE